ncbi:MAG: peptidoglycan-binding protein [Acidobacteria bacterium]|nr:peptidoglycan-binding protein [Acidobacteriota bacterium]
MRKSIPCALLILLSNRPLLGECDLRSYLELRKIEGLTAPQIEALEKPYTNSPMEQFVATLAEVTQRSDLGPRELPESAFTFSTILAQTVLNDLGYGVKLTGAIDGPTSAALKRVQQIHGLKETGTFTMQTMCVLVEAGEARKEPEFVLPRKSISWGESLVEATGTFVMSNAKSFTPFQTSSIECNRTLRKCVDTTVHILYTDGQLLPSLNIDEYEISDWGESEIITKPRKTAFGCVQYTLRLNSIQESVSMLRSTISTEGACALADKKEYYLTLEDGLKISIERAKANRERWTKYAAPEWEKMKQLFKPDRPKP